jgi:hypothetical protein
LLSTVARFPEMPSMVVQAAVACGPSIQRLREHIRLLGRKSMVFVRHKST